MLVKVGVQGFRVRGSKLHGSGLVMLPFGLSCKGFGFMASFGGRVLILYHRVYSRLYLSVIPWFGA